VNVACVIGNGPSRKPLNLEYINSIMTTYGCNALYRDFLPDHLIAVDINMVYEIIDSKIHYNIPFYTQHSTKTDALYKNGEPIEFIPNQPSTYDSGNAAIDLAAINKHDIIYMVGFDYVVNDTIPNIYTGTKNYTTNHFIPGANQQDVRWKKTLKHIIKKYPNTRFVRVMGNENNNINIKLDNFIEITTNEFTEELYGIYN